MALSFDDVDAGKDESIGEAVGRAVDHNIPLLTRCAFCRKIKTREKGTQYK